MSTEREPCDLQVSDCGLAEFLALAATFGSARYAYAVTPNADHLIRYRSDRDFRAIYRQATFVLMDSRFLAQVLRLTTGVRLPTCTGSDLTAQLFDSVIAPDDQIVLIGGGADQADTLRRRFALNRLRHHNPPMGFITDADAVDACLRFIEEASPFRFCFLAVGSPQQEILANRLLTRGRARGLALCIGGAVNFLTGGERRAPEWMRRAGVEWLYRLLQDPARMAHRYLIRGPRIFLMLPKFRFVLRAPSAAPGATAA